MDRNLCRTTFFGRRSVRRSMPPCLAGFLLLSQPALATNPELQALFFEACANPTAALAARCGETTAGLGNLSGDSESSLNPSQPLSGNAQALRAAANRADDARARSQNDLPAEGVRVDIGRFSLLASYAHTWEERDRTVDVDGERGYDADTDGVEVGFDYRLNDAAFAGLLISWKSLDLEFDGENTGTNFSPASQAGSIEGDSLGITGFASFAFGERYLDLSAGYLAGDNDYERRSVFQESTRTVPQTDSLTKGNADTQELWASVNAGWNIPMDQWTIGVHGGLTWSRSEIDSYTEDDLTGSGLAMSFSGSEQTSLIGQLGARFQYAISTASGVIIPHAGITYQHEFEDNAADLRAGYVLDAGDNTLALAGDDPDLDFFTATAGISAVLANGWMPFVDVSYWAGYQDLDRVRLLVGLRKEL